MWDPRSEQREKRPALLDPEGRRGIVIVRERERKKKKIAKKPRARSVTRQCDQFAKANALCYFFDSRSLDDRRACRANWQHAGTREFPDRANLCGGGGVGGGLQFEQLFFLFSKSVLYLYSRDETRESDEIVIMMMMMMMMVAWIRYLPLPFTASIGADRDANANEFTCERSLEFEVVWINEINAEGWEIIYIYIWNSLLVFARKMGERRDCHDTFSWNSINLMKGF